MYRVVLVQQILQIYCIILNQDTSEKIENDATVKTNLSRTNTQSLSLSFSLFLSLSLYFHFHFELVTLYVVEEVVWPLDVQPKFNLPIIWHFKAKVKTQGQPVNCNGQTYFIHLHTFSLSLSHTNTHIHTHICSCHTHVL